MGDVIDVHPAQPARAHRGFDAGPEQPEAVPRVDLAPLLPAQAGRRLDQRDPPMSSADCGFRLAGRYGAVEASSRSIIGRRTRV